MSYQSHFLDDIARINRELAMIDRQLLPKVYRASRRYYDDGLRQSGGEVLPLIKDATGAGKFVRSTMKGRAEVDSNDGVVRFKSRKDAERFEQWQSRSKRNGFGRNGLSGGRR